MNNILTNESGGNQKKFSLRVTLEPRLEKIAKSWAPAKRFEAARTFKRWARQLEISAKIIAFDARGQSVRPPQLPKLPRRKAALN
jgi:hypothetical protein